MCETTYKQTNKQNLVFDLEKVRKNLFESNEAGTEDIGSKCDRKLKRELIREIQNRENFLVKEEDMA